MGFKSFIRTLAIGAGAGAAVVYFNDPHRGQQRRQEFMEKAGRTIDDAQGAVEGAKEKFNDVADDVRDQTEDAADQGGSSSGRGGTVDLTGSEPVPATSSMPIDDSMPSQPLP